MNSEKLLVEVCFSPILLNTIQLSKNSNVVIVDVLRATSSICTAFNNGAECIIPVETLEEAIDYKKRGYIVAAERDGIVKDFADFGNCPSYFTKEIVSGKTIVYSTTNGTQLIHQVSDFYRVIIGSFLNIDALTSFLIDDKHDVLIVCAGWKGRFNIEDTLLAGALSEKLLQSETFSTVCDSAHASIALWHKAKENLPQFIEKAAQRHRLKKNKLDGIIPYCFSTNITNVIPVFDKGKLILLK